MLDIEAKIIDITTRDDGKVVWINTEDGCVFRACQIKTIVMNDLRKTDITPMATVSRQWIKISKYLKSLTNKKIV